MKRLMLLALLVWSVLAGVRPLTTVAAVTGRQILHQDTYELEGVYAENACGGEGIAFRTMVTLEMSQVADARGGVHFLLKQSERGTGTGLTTGATYQLSGVNNWTINTLPSGGQVLTFQGHGKTIGQGSVNNLITTFLVHLTQTPNGDWTASVDTLDSTCVG